MPRFQTDLILDPQPDRKWRVVFPFVYESDIAGTIIVAPGFLCDLNSIPRFCWWVSTPTDYPEAGVIHDWGYRGNLTRETADAVYLELLLHLGMSRTRAYLRYRALRVFGRFSYKGVKPSKRP